MSCNIQIFVNCWRISNKNLREALVFLLHGGGLSKVRLLSETFSNHFDKHLNLGLSRRNIFSKAIFKMCNWERVFINIQVTSYVKRPGLNAGYQNVNKHNVEYKYIEYRIFSSTILIMILLTVIASSQPKSIRCIEIRVHFGHRGQMSSTTCDYRGQMSSTYLFRRLKLSMFLID